VPLFCFVETDYLIKKDSSDCMPIRLWHRTKHVFSVVILVLDTVLLFSCKLGKSNIFTFFDQFDARYFFFDKKFLIVDKKED
jgi:hypothetical protein